MAAGNRSNGKAKVTPVAGNGASSNGYSPARPIRLALVGCGYWGPKVIRASASVPQVEIAALVDRDLQAARNTGRHYPAARVCDSLTEALVGGEIDAVIVATPPATHTEVASEALEAGKHVLVEKPLAKSADDCQMLGELATENGVVLMAGHTFRFSPAVQQVKSLLAGRELGEVYSVDSRRLNLGRVRQDVDAIWNFAPHDISIIHYWFGGSPNAVICHGYGWLQPGIADRATMVFEYDYAVATIQVSWLSPLKVREMTVVGSKKMVVYDDVAGQVVVHDAGIDREHLSRSFADFDSYGEFKLIQRSGDVHIPKLASVEPLAEQCKHFVDCILTGKEPVTGVAEATAVVEILEAASASMQAGGERIELKELARV
jgi:predicted dehydrogenase